MAKLNIIWDNNTGCLVPGGRAKGALKKSQMFKTGLWIPKQDWNFHHTSNSQPGWRGTLGCRELVSGVPLIITIPWALYLGKQPGVPPNRFNTK